MYYVYMYIDPRTNLPFYIGKGSGDRYKVHLYETKETTENYKKWAYIQGLKNKNLEPIIEIVGEYEEETEAYNHETILIKKYGRKNIDADGILTNMCIDNRPPNSKGKIHTDESRRNMSLSKIGEKNAMFGKIGELHHNFGKEGLIGYKNPFFGKTHTDEQKIKWCGWDRNGSKGKTFTEMYGEEKAEKMIQNLKQKLTGKKHSIDLIKKMSIIKKGKKLSEETKQKIGVSSKGRKQSIETIKKRIETRRKNGSYKQSEKTKQKIRESLMGRKLSEETRQRMIESHKRRTKGNDDEK